MIRTPVMPVVTSPRIGGSCKVGRCYLPTLPYPPIRYKGVQGVQGVKTRLVVPPGAFPLGSWYPLRRGYAGALLGKGSGTLTTTAPSPRKSPSHLLRSVVDARPAKYELDGQPTRTVPTCPKGETLLPLGSFETGLERSPARMTDKNDHCGRAREQPVNGQSARPVRAGQGGTLVYRPAPSGTTPDLRARGGSPGPTGRPKGRSDPGGLHRSPVEGIAR